jgi:DNA mismatch endonuclease, patch repair protein
MKSNKARGTAPELVLSRVLRKDLAVTKLPGRPDLVYTRKKLAIFVQGCFWHRCPVCNFPLPKSNSEFWKRKFERNVERDRLNKEELETLGWKSIEVWEHEIRENPTRIKRRVELALARRDSPAILVRRGSS